jgi:hypothetical protein
LGCFLAGGTGGGGTEEEKKKKKKKRNASNSAGKDVLHPPSNFFFFFFFLEFSFSFLSSLSLHLFLRSFVSFFRDWNVLVGLFPTFFRRSPRSFVLLFPVFPIPSRRPNGDGNSAQQKPIDREFRFEKILAPNLIHGGV